jgi:hypothetical protein
MCFSLAWFAQLLIFIVVVCFVVAILKIWLLPFVAALGDWGGRVVQTINLIVALIVVIFVIWLCVDLIQCAMGGGFFAHR